MTAGAAALADLAEAAATISASPAGSAGAFGRSASARLLASACVRTPDEAAAAALTGLLIPAATIAKAAGRRFISGRPAQSKQQIPLPSNAPDASQRSQRLLATSASLPQPPHATGIARRVLCLRGFAVPSETSPASTSASATCTSCLFKSLIVSIPLAQRPGSSGSFSWVDCIGVGGVSLPTDRARYVRAFPQRGLGDFDSAAAFEERTLTRRVTLFTFQRAASDHTGRVGSIIQGKRRVN